MLKRLTIAIVVACISAAGSFAAAATITVQAFPQTGEIRFVNTSAASFDFILYWVRSNNGALIGSPAVWKSITGNHDVNGDGSIDPTSEWLKFNHSPYELVEATFGPGGTLAPFGVYELGPIWIVSASPTFDLSVVVVQADEQFADIDLTLALVGDYNGDLAVNALDYNAWQAAFGSTSMPLVDGNLNGVVDAADYTVWRDNLGTSLPGAASQAGGGLALAAVPEPASLALLLLAFVSAAPLRARRR